jgi:hypothetical protein
MAVTEIASILHNPAILLQNEEVTGKQLKIKSANHQAILALLTALSYGISRCTPYFTQ